MSDALAHDGAVTFDASLDAHVVARAQVHIAAARTLRVTARIWTDAAGAVIAVLAKIDLRIATRLKHALRRAPVAIVVVAIVALFEVCGKVVHPTDAVAAPGQIAVVRAGVIRVIVSVVALLTGINDAVAATRGVTHARRALAHPTRSHLARVAAIAREPIAIVALLDALLYLAIATRRDLAGCETLVRVRRVPVIAGLARINDAVAACGWHTDRPRGDPLRIQPDRQNPDHASSSLAR